MQGHDLYCRQQVVERWFHIDRWLSWWHHVSQYFVFIWLPETWRSENTIRGNLFMTSTKIFLFFGPYRSVHFEANLLHNIDCVHLNFSLTRPHPPLRIFFHCFLRKFCQKSKLVGLVALKSTFLRRDNNNNKKKEEEEEFNLAPRPHF